MAKLHCNNSNCQHYDNMYCTAAEVYYVDRLCITFRKRKRKENYRELMRADVGICRRARGKMTSRNPDIFK